MTGTNHFFSNFFSRVSIGKILVIFFGAAIILVITAGIFTVIFNKRLADSIQSVEHHTHVLVEAEQTLSIEKDLSSGGYTLTGDSSFLDNYFSAKKTIFKHLDSLKQLTSTDSFQQLLTDSLYAITRLRINFADENIRWRNAEGYNLQRRLAAANQNRVHVTLVRDIVARIEKEENRQLRLGNTDSVRRQFAFNSIFGLLLAAIILLLIAAFVVISYNLSRRTNAEKLLKISEERLQLALEGTAAGVWDWDLKTDKRWWSHKYYELLGYRNNEITPTLETAKTLIHPEDVERTFKLLDDHLHNKARFELEYRMKTKSGGYKWVLGTGQAQFDGHNLPVRMVGSIVDIDQRKQAEMLVQQQAALIQMLPDGIVFADENGCITSMNQGAEIMFGISNDLARGKKLLDIISHSAPGKSNELLRKDFDTHGFVRQEIEITNMAGQSTKVLATAKKFPGAGSSKVAWAAVYTDISLLKLNDELKAANDYLEQLAFISAHDFRAPIITISGLTDFLAKSTNDVKTIELLKKVTHEMQVKNDGLNEILRLRQSLLASKARGITNKPFNAIVHEVISAPENVLVGIGTYQLSIDPVAERQMPEVYIRQVINNLVTNSITFRKPAEQLLIEINGNINEAGDIIIEVNDNGTGFDATRNEKKLFGIFKRFHSQTEGAGVGLHIVKSVVSAYNGQVEIKSIPGAGTKVKITFGRSVIQEWNT